MQVADRLYMRFDFVRDGRAMAVGHAAGPRFHVMPVQGHGEARGEFLTQVTPISLIPFA